jgi:hypothetical protein
MPISRGWFKFETNIQAAVIFLDDGTLRESTDERYGDQWVYRIRTEGQDVNWGATIKAHEFLLLHNIGHGDSVHLTKKEIPGSKAKGWLLQLPTGESFASWQEEGLEGTARPSPDTSGNLANGGPDYTGDRLAPTEAAQVPSLASIGALYRSCLVSSWVIWRDWTHTSEDIRTTATTLFMEANKRNIPAGEARIQEFIEDAKRWAVEQQDAEDVIAQARQDAEDGRNG